MESNNIDNITSYSHTLRYVLNNSRKRNKETFNTVHDNSMVSWDLLVDRQFPARALLRLQNSSNRYCIRLEESGLTTTNPPVKSIEYRVRILDDCSNDVITPCHYKISGMARSNRRMVYTTDLNSEISLILTKAHEEQTYRGKIMEIVTTINFSESDLDQPRASQLDAPSVPLELDYTFNSLVDKSRHDFRIIARQGGGHLPLSKECLFLASHYFRNRLTNAMVEYTEETGSIEAIETTITYMITGCYKAPKTMTPQFAADCLTLAHQYRVNEFGMLKNSVEKHCLEELNMKSDDLNFVVRMLISAHDSGMASLLNSCIGAIVCKHFQQFLNEYLNANHQLRERLTTRQGIARPPLAVVIKRAFVYNLQVRRYTRKLIDTADD